MATLGVEVGKLADKYRKMVKMHKEIVEAAADDAKRVAMEKTPHKGDAGTSLTTGDLASHWNRKIDWDKNGETFTVYLTNTMKYASFVNDGHRMDRHFVPWLRVDASGELRFEKPIPGEPLFGITVGVKTRYIPPVDMVTPAVDEFFKRYEIGMKNMLDKFNDK